MLTCHFYSENRDNPSLMHQRNSKTKSSIQLVIPLTDKAHQSFNTVVSQKNQAFCPEVVQYLTAVSDEPIVKCVIRLFTVNFNTFRLKIKNFSENPTFS